MKDIKGMREWLLKTQGALGAMKGNGGLDNSPAIGELLMIPLLDIYEHLEYIEKRLPKEQP